jgi:parafibromin
MQAPSKGAPSQASAAAPGSNRRPAQTEAQKTAPTAGAVPVAAGAQRGEGAAATPASSTGPIKHYPTIIVPSAMTSTITMLNVQDFLIKGEFITVEDKRKTSTQRARELFLPRKIDDNHTIVYRVLDDPTKLKDAEWNHVVAVFATGQSWQFKGWKYPTPVSLFQNVLGVHVCLDSAAVDANIQSWNCKVIKVRPLFSECIPLPA